MAATFSETGFRPGRFWCPRFECDENSAKMGTCPTHGKPLVSYEVKALVQEEAGKVFNRRLDELLTDYRAPKIPQIAQAALSPTSARELQAREFPAQRWLVQGLIPTGGLTFLAGKRGSLKTLFALELGLAVGSGKPLLGHDAWTTTQASVLFLDWENTPSLIHDRLQGRELPEGMAFLFPSDAAGFKLDNAAGRELLGAYLRDHPGTVCLVDTFRRVLALDENDAREVSEAMLVMKSLAAEYGATFILLHHLRKGQGFKGEADLAEEMRGSSEMANLADSILALDRKRAVGLVVLRHEKSRSGVEHEPVRLRPVGGSGGEPLRLVYEGSWADAENQPEQVARELLRWANGEGIEDFQTSQVQDAMRKLGYNPKAVGRALRFLVDAGKLTKPAKGRFQLPKTLLSHDGTMGQMGQEPNGGLSDEP